ncbi:MAG: hypothetical protein A2667_03235 [Candidatus Wildermuthbacteria bacterium RIFCSPHIGHO2_01_FULL_47_27]|uniref:Serine protease n=1 Tax=Candidatus Wildermuthbacteria bacterium RIFCSPHIGHO2_02_FULL_47_17 TaxID=1802452 RepID=A0A1G2R5I7_9BACT|nr:MAG: hypothetical protein A2667_03235 [Candidatus Wildermuthbacteria bacterium RIFCSPHIGHO2_01_FULL_47_27]OHA68104.1 MAG: hypothetical protein A3D59_00895 [Candidatus Wildermuthbacteria bacterium RIFCSPHIGHO2_02_FULL_47_17]
MFLKQLGALLVIFFFGIAGGIFGSQIVWPLFVERPLFYQYRLNQAPTYINETKEIVVQENTALTEAIEKVKKAVVGVQSINPAGKITFGSGLILTSDGRAVTLNNLVPAGFQPRIVAMGREVKYQVLKRDVQMNLALIKLEGNGFFTVGFADSLKLGTRVFLAANAVSFFVDGQPQEQFIVNEGVIRVFNNDEVQTTISDKKEVKGSPLFDIQGNLVGLNDVDSTGRVVAIPAQKIREFAGL